MLGVEHGSVLLEAVGQSRLGSGIGFGSPSDVFWQSSMLLAWWEAGMKAMEGTSL